MASCGFRYPVRRLAHPALAAALTPAFPGHFEAGSVNVANTSASCAVAHGTSEAAWPLGSMHSPVRSEKTADFLYVTITGFLKPWVSLPTTAKAPPMIASAARK